MSILLNGFGLHDFVLFAVRFILGFFFVSYRFRFLWDPASAPHLCNATRQHKLQAKLCHCGYGSSWGMACFIALSELLAGLGAIGGLLTVPSAVGLMLILVVATFCTGKEKTMRQNPIDKIDVVNCYLWNPEPVYMVLALVVMFFGPGMFSLDYAIAWFFSLV